MTAIVDTKTIFLIGATMATREVRTLTVLTSQAMGRADGRAAIRLDTRELGSIAFEVDQASIDDLRMAIAAAEVHIRQKLGNA